MKKSGKLEALLVPAIAGILSAFGSSCGVQTSNKIPTSLELPAGLSFQEFVQKENLADFANLAPLPKVTKIEDPNCNKNCQDLRQEFRYVVYVGKQIYCYWEEKKADTHTDFDALANQLEASITNKTSLTEYLLTLKSWASSFHDGHVNVMAGDDRSGLEIYTTSIRLEVLAPATDHEKVIVVQVKDTDKDANNVKVGDEVRSINGIPIHEALDQAELFSSGSTKRMRRFWAARLLVDVTGLKDGSETLSLTLLNEKGELRKATLSRNVEISAKPSPGAPQPPEGTGIENLEVVKVLPGSYGYIRINGFSGSQDEALFDQTMDKLAGTHGLILDLRKNSGGDLSGDRILARLANQAIIRYKRSERMSDLLIGARPETYFVPWTAGAAFADWHDLPVEPSAASKHYDRPVIALISPWCFSACDTFSAALRDNGLATFIGEPTGGGTGTPLVFDLPNSGLRFRYSVVRGRTPKGDAIEGHGTFPDLYMEPTLKDRTTKEDSQLMMAVAILSRQEGAIARGNTRSPELVHALQSMPPYWEQSMETSPTLHVERELQKILKKDELQ